ncbi:MAG: gliding motility-associated C-terminal domain-containing protein, partial [Bacteroidales bacterium]|nr:gliding motility-associated C-terminal domain-containing protein [Bacteroidales bacterium]
GDNGSIHASALGGTAPYSYEWSTGATAEDISGLMAGNYLVTVTDAHNCVIYAMAEVHQPQLPIHAEIAATNIRCYGDANGACDLTVTGGTLPYTFQWNTGAISEDIDNLVPGFYDVTVSDVNGCAAYDSVHIYQSQYPLSGQISGRDASCNGNSDGYVFLTVDGGYEPYQYEWSTGLWSQNLVGVPAGTYTVTVTDANMCHREFTYVVGEPEPFYIQMMDDFSICYGMTTQIGIGIVSGGTAPYSVSWSNGESGLSTNVTPLETTTYYATIVDATNCSSSEQSVTVTVYDSIYLSVDLLSDNLVCAGSTASFNVRTAGGGVENNDVYVNGELISTPYEPIITQDTVLNFVVYDQCGYDSVAIPININIYEDTPIMISSNVTEGCAPLSVSFRDNAPNTGQSYLWNFADGDFENMSVARNPNHTFHNSGSYNINIQVTSSHNCRRDTTVTILVFEVPTADFRADRTNIALASPIVNFTNYSRGGFWYNWNFGDKTYSDESSPVHSFTAPGTFHVVLTTTSLYGCSDTTGVDIIVSNEHSIFVPTAFTPNNDDQNETFKVFANFIDKSQYSIVIYDRWGGAVFKSTDIDEEWDGSDGTHPCPPGVYTWRIHYKDMYGIDYEKKGTLMLLR